MPDTNISDAFYVPLSADWLKTANIQMICLLWARLSKQFAITLRESKSAFDNDWSAMLYDAKNDEYCFSKLYRLHIVDRIGGGDSFGSGLIYSLLSGKTTQEAVEFAVAASALKHAIEGDYNFATVAEVEKLAGGDGSGRVQR